MKNFEFIDHTADIGIMVYGSSLEEVFSNAAYGMFSIIANLANITDHISREITLTAYDREELLVAWLNHLLYLLDTDNLIFTRFKIIGLENDRLQVTAYGEVADPKRHELKTQIKAATYHQLEIVEENGFRAKVIFDL